MILTTKENKLLKTSEGKVLRSHNIPFTPICEGYIDYDPKTHSFSKKRGVPTSTSGSELRSDFRIPADLCGDFEISFVVMPSTYYVTLLVYNEKNSKVRGFYTSPAYLEHLMAASTVDKKNKITVSRVIQRDTYFNPMQYEQFAYLRSSTIFNKTWVIRRVGGIVSLYIDGKKYYTYEEKYLEDHLSIYGMINHLPSKITHFNIKQL